MVLALANDLVITLAVHREVKIWRLTTEPEQKCVFTLDEFGISVGWTQQRLLLLTGSSPFQGNAGQERQECSD